MLALHFQFLFRVLAIITLQENIDPTYVYMITEKFKPDIIKRMVDQRIEIRSNYRHDLPLKDKGDNIKIRIVVLNSKWPTEV